MELEGKVFVVTGGGNGDGAAGGTRTDRMWCPGRARRSQQDGLAEAVRLSEAGERISSHILNVSDAASVDALPAAVITAHGQVAGIVNIAGIIHRFVHFTELTDEEQKRIMDVNF